MQVPVGGFRGQSRSVVVCDDGAVFFWGLMNAEDGPCEGWVEMEPIPGTERALTKEEKADGLQ
jgi:hypothetical protein